MNVAAAARAAAILDGVTSVASVEPERSIARITVPSFRGWAIATCGRATPTISVADCEDDERRQVTAPARSAIDDVDEQREVREPQCVLDAPALDQKVRGKQQRHEHQSEQCNRGREGHRRTLSIWRKRTSGFSQSPEVDTTTWATPADRSDRARSSRSAAALSAKRERTRASRVSTWGAARASPGRRARRFRRSVSSCSRRSRISTATTSCRAVRPRRGFLQSSGPRKSETATMSDRRRTSRAARSHASPKDVAPCGWRRRLAAAVTHGAGRGGRSDRGGRAGRWDRGRRRSRLRAGCRVEQ